MGTVNYGNQLIAVNFGAPVDAYVVNARDTGLEAVGLYSGGLLTKLTNTSVTLSALLCAISDGTYQTRIQTQDAVSVTVGPLTPFVVLRWEQPVATSRYMDILAVAEASILSTDLVVGKCLFSGSTLIGIDYTDRTFPVVADKFLRVVPTSPASMRVHIKSGWITTTGSRIFIEEQDSALIVAPVTQPRIDYLYINTSTGAVMVETGSEAATPVAKDYAGRIVLAEIDLVVGQTSITTASIKDARNLVGSSHGVPSIVRQVLEQVYQVGAVYISYVATNPAVLFGFGTWVACGVGRVFVGINPSDTDFDTVGETGGAKAHTLTIDEMPSHRHTLKASYDDGNGEGYDQWTIRPWKDSNPDPVLADDSMVLAGGGNAHNNLQPYEVVYKFRRIA